MIRPYRKEDQHKISQLLKNFTDQLESKSNPYRHAILLEKEEPKGILIYDEIYDRFELIYIYISKEERKLGYGSALMEYFIKLVEEKKGTNITLEVDETNDDALHLYKKYGFKKIAIREKYYQNHNGYLMIRKM